MDNKKLVFLVTVVIYEKFVSEKKLGTVYGKKKKKIAEERREPFFSDWQDINISS